MASFFNALFHEICSHSGHSKGFYNLKFFVTVDFDGRQYICLGIWNKHKTTFVYQKIKWKQNYFMLTEAFFNEITLFHVFIYQVKNIFEHLDIKYSPNKWHASIDMIFIGLSSNCKINAWKVFQISEYWRFKWHGIWAFCFQSCVKRVHWDIVLSMNRPNNSKFRPASQCHSFLIVDRFYKVKTWHLNWTNLSHLKVSLGALLALIT